MIFSSTPYVGLGIIQLPTFWVAEEAPPVEEVYELCVTIGGVDVSNHLIQGSVDISRSLDNRGTLRFGIRDDTCSLHYQPGQEVYAYWGAEAIFGGKIESVDEQIPRWDDSTLLIGIDVTDWSRLFDRFLVAASYEADPDTHPDWWTLSEIITDIINEQTPLDVEGIVIGSIPFFQFRNGRIKFKHERASQCLRDLCQLTGCSWSVSPEKILTVYDRSTNEAPWTIGESTGGLQSYRGIKLKRSIESYRNVQWLLAGKDVTGWRDEYFHGDTTTEEASTKKRTFTLVYPMANCIPTITRTGGPEPGIQIYLGIRGVDKDGDLDFTNWPRWFYKVGEREITQNSASNETLNPTLDPNETLTVHYKGSFDCVVEEVDEDRVADRVAIEGGSGIYEAAEEDQNLDTRDLASERARRLLEQFGRIPNTLTYQIDRSDLEPGMLQSIKIAALAQDAQFLIEEVHLTFPKFDLLRCDVTALDGERQEGWTEFWRRTMYTGRVFAIRENEVIDKYSRREENLSITDTLLDSVHDTIVVPGILSDPYTVALIGAFTVPGSESTAIGLARVGWSKIGAPIASP